MKILSIILPALLLVFSCSKSPDFPTYNNMDVTSAFVLDNAIIIQKGDCAGDQNEGNYICFVRVTEDSRCPEGVVCIWQGNARAEFRYSGSGNEPVVFGLNTYAGFTTDTIIGDYKFTLKNVTPYPSVTRIFEPGGYKAQIEIQKVSR